MPKPKIKISKTVASGGVIPASISGTPATPPTMTVGQPVDSSSWPTIAGDPELLGGTYLIEATSDGGATIVPVVVDTVPVQPPTPTQADAGKRLRKRLVARNAATQSASPPSAISGWSPPIIPEVVIAPLVFTSLPQITGTPTAGQVLTGAFTVTGGAAPVTIERRWLDDDVPVSGATSATWTVPTGISGSVIWLQVRATDALGNTTGWIDSNAMTVTGTVSGGLRAEVIALGADNATGVRSSASPLKRIGVDALPSGIVWNTAEGFIRAAGNATMTGWDLTDVTTPAGQKNLSLNSFSTSTTAKTQVFRDMLMGEKDFPGLGSGGGALLTVTHNSAPVDLTMDHVTTYGYDGAGSYSEDVNVSVGAGSAIRFTNCRFIHTTADTFKIRTGLIQRCMIDRPRNMPANILPWNAVTVYQPGDVALGAGADATKNYRCRKVGGSTGDVLPTGTGSNTAWTHWSPHTDLVNPNSGDLVISGLYVAVDPAGDDRLNGPTQIIRTVSNSGSDANIRQITVRGLVVSGQWENYPFAFAGQNEYSSGTTYAAGRRCRVGPRFFESLSSGNLNHNPLTSPTYWKQVLSAGVEGPMVLQHCYLDAGAINLSSWWYPKAGDEPRHPIIHDHVKTYDGTADIIPPPYAVLRDSAEPDLDDTTHYPINAWSAEGESFLITASSYETIALTGGTTVQGCLVQIESALIGYIHAGGFAFVPGQDSVWTATNISGGWRLRAQSMHDSSYLRGRARIIGGAATVAVSNVAAPVVQSITLGAQTYPDLSPYEFVSPHLGSTGRDYGYIPLSGTGTPGATVEARAFDAQYAGTRTTAWKTIATVGAGGTWSANWECPMTFFKALPEVRVQGDTTIHRGTVPFSVGLILFPNGQSNIGTGFANYYGNANSRDTVLEPGHVFIAHLGMNAGAYVTNDPDYPFPGSLPVDIANYFATRWPGIRVRLGCPARQGTGPDQLMDDTESERLWSDELEIFNAITYNGLVKPCVTSFFWFANPVGFQNNYGRFFAEVLTSKRADGTPFVANGGYAETTKANGGLVRLDHTWAELFGTAWADTRVSNGTFGYPFAISANEVMLRPSWIKAIEDLPHFAAIVEDADYGNIAACSHGDSVNSDTSHPSGRGFAGVDGAVRFHKGMIDIMARTAGLTSWNNPVFDQIYWEPTGAYVEVWSSAGPVNNIWGWRGETPVAGMRKVLGFTVNGGRPYDADIVNGRVRIYPEGGAFTGLNFLNFDFNDDNLNPVKVGATDTFNHFWKGWPSVSSAAVPGATALESVCIDTNLSKERNPSLLNTPTWLPAPTPFFVNQASGSGSLLRAGSVTPPAIEKLLAAFRFNTTASSDGVRVMELGSGSSTTDIYVNGASNTMQVRLRVGTTVIYQATYPLNKATVLNHIVIADATTRTVRVYQLTGAEETLTEVVPQTATVVTAWASENYTFNGGQVRLFNNSSANRSLAAPVLGGIVIAATPPDSTAFDPLVIGSDEEAANVLALSQRMLRGGVTAYAGRAQVVIGDQTTAAMYNAGTANVGMGGSLVASGSFTAI